MPAIGRLFGERGISEEANPQLAIDIRLTVEPHTQSDPELKTERRYTNLSAAEVPVALVERGHDENQLPSERTIRDILNRMNYQLKRIQKGKPLKKTEDTDAIFENVHAAREQYQDDQETLEISVDTKTKVSLGEYVLGEKNRTDSKGKGIGSNENRPMFQARDRVEHALHLVHAHYDRQLRVRLVVRNSYDYPVLAQRGPVEKSNR